MQRMTAMQHHTRQQTVDFEVGANNIAVIPSQLELAVTNIDLESLW